MVPTDYLDRDIATTVALYTYIAISVDVSPRGANASTHTGSKSFFLSSLIKAVEHAVRFVRRADDRTIQCGPMTIAVDSAGTAVGFRQCMTHASLHIAVQRLLEKESCPARCFIVAKQF